MKVVTSYLCVILIHSFYYFLLEKYIFSYLTIEIIYQIVKIQIYYLLLEKCTVNHLTI